MSNIEAKALALVNEVERERAADIHGKTELIMRGLVMDEALCRALEQHEAFKQEVSDAVGEYTCHPSTFAFRDLERFIIPKPDPLVDVAESLGYFNTAAQGWAGDVRAALEARGLEIREKK